MAESGPSFRKFLLLWSGELVSATGSGLTAFGLSVYVFRQTGKASAVGLVALLAFLPSLLLSAPAGVLADRHDRRLLMVAGDLLSALGPIFLLVCFFRREAALWQVCVGVVVSSTFSSLLEPAYRATITDLLTKDEYTKASGLVNVAGSAKYLVSPVLAGLLLTVSDIRLLLAIDAATFFVTCASTLAVRRGLPTKASEREASLFAMGIFLALFGVRENAALICAAGFLFLATLPPTNACLDYLVRTNIDNSVQGRARGLIGLLSQTGYAVAYAGVGYLSDAVFAPLLAAGGTLAGSVGRVIGTGEGRGSGFLIIVSGLLLSATAIALFASRSIKGLEQGGYR